MERHTIMRAEVKADCYAGKDCDQVQTFFELYCDGDRDSDESYKDITIRLRELPPGATVEVKYPNCPQCGIPREDLFKSTRSGMKIVGHKPTCCCGFNWEEWVLEQYS